MPTPTTAQPADLRPAFAVLTGEQIRHIAWLQLHLRRWESMMDRHHAQEEATGCEIPVWAWHAYSDEAEAIAERLVFFRDTFLAPLAG